MSFFVVNKKFDGNGETFLFGDVVDTTNWKYTQQLVSLRYLIPADATVTEESRVAREVIEVVVEKTKPTSEKHKAKPNRTLERKVEELSTSELLDA